MSNYFLELPSDLIDQAQRLATERQVSLNEWLLDAIIQRIEAEQVMQQFQPYAEKLDEARLSAILARVPDVDPLPGDELD